MKQVDLRGNGMKGHYKNWYQHYLALEAQKERDVQRAYFSNYEPENLDEVAEDSEDFLSSTILENVPVKRHNRFQLIGLLLPLVTISGFVFLWYQLDIGPVRDIVHEAFVHIGVREEINDAQAREALLDAHARLQVAMASYVAGSEDFAPVMGAYEALRSNQEAYMAALSAPNRETLTEKLAHAQQMVEALQTAYTQADFVAFLETQSSLRAQLY